MVGSAWVLNTTRATYQLIMPNTKAIADRLLVQFKIFLTIEEMKKIVDRFVSEMDMGLTAVGSCLSMLPSFIGIDEPVPAGKPVIVIDAGGTNLRVCAVEFDSQGGFQIEHRNQMLMPGAKEEISKEEFYQSICDFLMPVIHLSDRIGFCFSYPVAIDAQKDGKLLYWTKEIKVPEVVGTFIGSGLNKFLKKRGIAEKKIVILNDTVATLLAGKAKGQARQCESYIGFILGTGTNTAYIERNERILKIPQKTGAQIVNVESGGFSAFRRGKVDQQFDLSTDTPGTHIFEKMISGVYLGPLVLKVLQSAAVEGAFSGHTQSHLRNLTSLETSGISQFLENPHQANPGFALEQTPGYDLELMYHLVNGVILRAGQLAAINLTAAIIKSGKGRNPLHPICINVDGSTYHKLFGLKQVVETKLSQLLKDLDVYYQLVKTDHSPIIGAAIAGYCG